MNGEKDFDIAGMRRAANAAAEAAPPLENRAGFSIREISDDLFDRMTGGNTYKR